MQINTEAHGGKRDWNIKMQQERWDFSLSLVFKVREKVADSVTSLERLARERRGRRENALLIRQNKLPVSSSWKGRRASVGPLEVTSSNRRYLCYRRKTPSAVFHSPFSVSAANVRRCCFEAIFFIILADLKFLFKGFCSRRKNC